MATTCVALLLNSVRPTSGANILVIIPCTDPSHFYVFKPLVAELTNRGHNLWVVSHFPQSANGKSNYVDIDISSSRLPRLQNNVSLLKQDLYTDYYLSLYYNFDGVFEDAKSSVQILQTNELKQLLNTSVKFDLALIELFSSDIFIGFAHKFNVPLITMIASMSLPWSNDRVSNIENPAYTTHMYSLHASRMNFKQRLVNTVSLILAKSVHAYINFFAERHARRFFGEDLPPFCSLLKNTSLVFVNSFPVFHGVRPNTPQVIEIGGIHVTPAQQLPHVRQII